MLENFIIAIESRLNNDAALTAVVPAERIGTYIKDDATFPHILWSLEGTERGESKSEESYDGNLVLEVFSEYRGHLEAYQIQALIYSALETPLTVTDADNYVLAFGTVGVATEPDNRVTNATITYTFMIGES